MAWPEWNDQNGEYFLDEYLLDHLRDYRYRRVQVWQCLGRPVLRKRVDRYRSLSVLSRGRGEEAWAFPVVRSREAV
jgi:hypothetical protein